MSEISYEDALAHFGVKAGKTSIAGAKRAVKNQQNLRVLRNAGLKL